MKDRFRVGDKVIFHNVHDIRDFEWREADGKVGVITNIGAPYVTYRYIVQIGDLDGFPLSFEELEAV